MEDSELSRLWNLSNPKQEYGFTIPSQRDFIFFCVEERKYLCERIFPGQACNDVIDLVYSESEYALAGGAQVRQG